MDENGNTDNNLYVIRVMRVEDVEQSRQWNECEGTMVRGSANRDMMINALSRFSWIFQMRWNVEGSHQGHYVYGSAWHYLRVG